MSNDIPESAYKTAQAGLFGQKTDKKNPKIIKSQPGTDQETAGKQVKNPVTTQKQGKPATVPAAEIPWLPSGFAKLRQTRQATELKKILRDKLAYDETYQQWFIYRDGYWQATNGETGYRLIMGIMEKAVPSGFKVSHLDAVVRNVRAKVTCPGWSDSRHLLPCSNAVLDINEGQPIEHSPGQWLNWQLPFKYDPDAECPTIMQWLEGTTRGDKSSIELLRGVFWFAMTGATELQRFIEIIGPGSTAKSTFIRLLEAFIGPSNRTTTTFKELETNRFETASLYGKRLAIINDSREYEGAVSILKAATGGDPLRLERKHKQTGSFTFDGLFIIVANQPTKTSDQTSGLIRRRMPIIFSKKVTDADKAKWASRGGIEKVMRAELPGLLNWVLAMGQTRALAAFSGDGGLNQTQREHLATTHKLAPWVDDNCVIDSSARSPIGKRPISGTEAGSVKHDQLYPNYYIWCDESNIRHRVSTQDFSRILLELLDTLGHPAEKKRVSGGYSGNVITGIAVRGESGNYADLPTPVTGQILTGYPTK